MAEEQQAQEPPASPTNPPPPFQQTVAYLDWVLGDDSKPVVRIFGSTPSGQKSVLHLHECYPYLYCDIPAVIPAEEFVIELKHRIELFLKGEKQRGRSRVFRTTLERDRVPIYGFADAIDVCKVELFDPGDVRRVCEFLASESIRVYNANVGYLLQVMVDLDLSGMDLITCSKYCFRGPLPSIEDSKSRAYQFRHALQFTTDVILWTKELNLPKDYIIEVPRYEMIYDSWHSHAARPARTSTCELELDVTVVDVLNIKPGPPPGSLATKKVKFVRSLAAWWMAEEARRKAENSASDFGDDEEEMESNHIDSGESYVEDPFSFRKRLARLARKMAEQAKDGSGRTTPADFRRSQTETKFFRSPSAARSRTGDSYLDDEEEEECMSQSSGNFSQETLEVMKILQAWEHAKSISDDADSTPVRSPSQMTDEELLSQGATSPPIDSTLSTRRPVKEVRFAPSPVQIRPFEEDADGDEDDEEDEEAGNPWDDILASQKDFVEELHDQLDGGVFDQEEGTGANIREKEDQPSANPLAPTLVRSRTADIPRVTSFLMPPTPERGRQSMPAAAQDHVEKSVPDSCLTQTGPFLVPNRPPPSSQTLIAFAPEKLNPVVNQRLFYSDSRDVPRRIADEFANIHAPAPTSLLDSLSPAFENEALFHSSSSKRIRWLEPVRAAPATHQHDLAGRNTAIPQVVTSSKTTSPVKVGAVSQLSQPSSLSHATPGNPVTGNQKKTSLRTALEKNPENNHLTLLGLEIFAKNRPTAAGREGKGKPFALLPDPQYDPVIAIFYCVRDDQRDELEGTGRGSTDESGMMYWDNTVHAGEVPQWLGIEPTKHKTEVFSNEVSLFRAFVQLVRDVDPDVLMGWEVQKDSLGYLLQRAKILGEVNFPRDLSRVPYGQQDRRHEKDEWGDAEHSGFWIAGRHIFNLWRVCREELKLTSYTIHNVLTQLTGEKLPRYSAGVLCSWWETSLNTKFLVAKHFKQRVMTLLRVCDHLDILGRNSELARLFGMDLFSVMTRGSQFRVEAVLLRICKGLGYLMLSPTRKQVAMQPAMEATPLIFEPQSAFYASPVLVLDFRSLYPSVIIANNICFSTCLGRLKQNVGASSTAHGSEDGENEDNAFIPGLGVDAGYYPPLPSLIKKDDYGFVSPNGVCFVSKKKREGILPRMLREILDTRVMIKSSVEGPGVEESKRRVADARQFGLKMIANVTYGYTAASFSGRMPCAEIADAIVQTGRACLELAVKIVHDRNAPWAPAECVYGDTDSLFVHLPGRDLEEARKLGKMISDKVSQSLPKPMKLQFEKVFFPCVLEVKKRYVGWKYSSKPPPPGEKDKATLDAKGIETIRRDGCPAVVKTLEATLKEIFTSRDLSKVKSHLREEFDKMFAGTVSLSEFIITGKVKLGSYAKDRKNKGNYPPAAVVADKMMKRDPRAKPLYKERVGYVVACGPPGSRLIDLVVDPQELLLKSLRVNVAHYIDKLILPALDRLLSCAGVDVKSWFQFDKSKNLWGGWRRRLNTAAASTNQIHRFFECVPCVLCSKPSVGQQMSMFHGQSAVSVANYLCADCASDLQRARYTADVVAKEAEKRARKVLNTCANCVNGGEKNRETLGCPGSTAAAVGDLCLNLDCEDFFVRRRAMDRVVFDVETLNKIGCETPSDVL